MDEGGAFLVPTVLPTTSCFVALPEPFVRMYLGHANPNLGATVLELNWHSPSGTETAFVGWVGELAASDTLEMSLEFGRCLGLVEAMERVPGLRVGVSISNAVPAVPMVHMEPCTPDDWEIIQLHAGYLENEILRQICVVKHDQVIPVRIQQHILVHLIVTLPPDVPFARLSSNCEIAIAPKSRTTDSANDESSFLASHPLMLQPLETTMPDGFVRNLSLECDEILVHPITFAQLDGNKELPIRCVCVWEDIGKETKPPVVGRLRCSAMVVPNYVAIAKDFQDKLELENCTRLRIRELKCPPLTPLSITLSVPHMDLSWQDLLIDWWSNTNEIVVEPHGIQFQLEDSPVKLALRLRNDSKDIKADAPTGAFMDYTIISSLNVPRPEDITVECVSEPIAKAVAPKQSPLMWPAIQEQLKGIETFTNPIVSRSHAAARMLLGTYTPPGSVLLWGPRGVGKSTLLHIFEQKLRKSHSILCETVIVPCRDLRGLKMNTVKSKLQEAFDRALHFAPCVILLDDIDALIPPEAEDGSNMNEQARRLAEHLAELMKHVRAVQSAYAKQLHAIVHRADSLQIVHASTKKSVAVVATSRDAQGIHPYLRTCGLFDRPLELSLPDAHAREQILQALWKQKCLDNDEPTDLQLTAHKTEGFSPRDLHHVVDRALHQYTIQKRQRPDSSSMELMAGLTDFTPAALRGVDLFKSTIHWSDVGGLHEVRNTLKETLELPTMYMKLYRAAPLKLPSGVLLYGPPGCGKTMLANAVASECGLNFISVKGPEVLNKYIGASEQAVRDLFTRAAAAAPSVLFLDEFDAIAPRRGADNTGVTDRVVNQLLTFLDGVESRQGVYVMAATSRPDMIDPALLRPGRLDKSLYCGFPTAPERLDILRAVGRKMELAADARDYLAVVSTQSELYTGADLQAILYTAQLEAVHETLPYTSNPSTDWELEMKDERHVNYR
ncbi:peroxisome biogenesis factor [Thraustotheca clavata]|uniref:Peroxisomal ATPase PEX1 n=1 Tax=Thraustotheca clavata TaxID=74557 RepID=A0A1V9Y912_9STRA|nr:peroxisome biogenesis factor [Thraustotheca clavata]